MKTKEIEGISRFTDIDQLSVIEKRLINKSVDAAKKAYAPYSGFRVGASVLLDNDVILTGNNRENAAFPSGSCAERTVLTYAGANYPKNRIISMAISALEEESLTDEPVTPCGNCRQIIAEEQDRTGEKIRIILYGKSGIIVSDGIDPLLPLRFKFEKK